jgi:hypothetical protein
VKQIRKRLTYANVLSTITAFVVLTGATAFAAQQLGKKTVGAKQLKSNAVTTAKIKKNAVTKAKIKNGAVDTTKIADGSVSGTDINTASTPFSRIVHEARGSSTVTVPTETGKLAVFPLNNSTYTQEAGSDDSYVGSVDVTISSGCKEQREVVAYVSADPADPLNPMGQDIVAWGVYEDKNSSQVSVRVNLGPYLLGGARFQPSSATNHTLYLTLGGICKTGTGITATSGAVDVIGTKK